MTDIFMEGTLFALVGKFKLFHRYGIISKEPLLNLSDPCKMEAPD
jgi:hypothetical protein